LIFYFLIATCVLTLDQASKFFIAGTIGTGESIPVIKGFFHITLVLNKGIAFGLFSGNFIRFEIIGFAVIAAILVFFIRFSQDKKFLLNLGLSFILAGCIGNSIDRLRLGAVIDFLDFKIWPVFNIADSAISVGAFLVFLGVIAKHRNKAL